MEGTEETVMVRFRPQNKKMGVVLEGYEVRQGARNGGKRERSSSNGRKREMAVVKEDWQLRLGVRNREKKGTRQEEKEGIGG